MVLSPGTTPVHLDHDGDIAYMVSPGTKVTVIEDPGGKPARSVRANVPADGVAFALGGDSPVNAVAGSLPRKFLRPVPGG